MLFKFRKFRSFVFILVLINFFNLFSANVLAKIVGDCVFTAGSACRPAWWLRKSGKRYQASPFDWMKDYSLDSFVSCYENNFADFFENIEVIPKKGEKKNKKNISAYRKPREDGDKSVHRQVRDTKNNITSIHHFKEYISLEEGQAEVREKMINRGSKVNEIFKKSDTIILLCDRQKESLDDFKKFINKFSKLYPDRNIILVSVRNSKSNKVEKKVLYKGLAYHNGKKIDNSNRKKLKIIQYRFKNAYTDGQKYKWIGNENGWKTVVGDIELTNKIFNKNTDLSKVEY